MIDAATDRVDADHLRAHLRYRHAAERGGDKRRDLDDPQILKHPVHRPILSTRGRRGKTVAVGALIGVPVGVSLGMPNRGAERALIPPAGVGAAEVSPRRR
jgi:hypothetical protein